MLDGEFVPMEQVLFRIEQFLLPDADDRYLPVNIRKRKDTSSCPSARLDQILYQVALADHIRMIQIMYRDSEDELCLVPELREGDTSIKLPTKHLMDKLTEGRSRAVALCRCCYGNDSLEGLRASVDLASSYALQGMWPQVSELVASAGILLASKEKATDSAKEELRSQQERGKQAARRVNSCFTVLRNHALANRGQIVPSLIKELQTELSYFSYDTALEGANNRIGQSLLFGRNHATDIISELIDFFDRRMRSMADSNLPSSEEKENGKSKKLGASWGDLINFFRYESDVMQTWVNELEGSLLPQNKAALHLPFRICDEQKKGIAHPTQLCATMMCFSSALKVLSGSGLLKQLKELRIAMPVLIERKTCELSVIQEADLTNPSKADQVLRVVYELPITWEEVLSKHVEAADADSTGLLTAQISILLGVSQVFSNKLAKAEENLQIALEQLERQGLEMELNACELYNSIAQLMITRYRVCEGEKKSRLKQEALDWMLGTEQGAAAVNVSIFALTEQYAQKGGTYSAVSIEEEAKEIVIRRKISGLSVDDVNPSRKSVEAALRYLVRSHEILEAAHGPGHPAVATGCLAVASVQNILEGFEESREWLVRNLRCMEKLDPVPVRALAFVQLQLSQVLYKQGYEEESLAVLSKAAAFHWAASIDGLAKISEESYVGRAVAHPPRKGQTLYDDIMMAADLYARIIRAHGRKGNVQEAAVIAEDVAEMLERAFDWDNLLVAEARREAGERYAAMGNWAMACSSLKGSLGGFQAVCSKKDKRVLEVTRLLAAAMENKMRTQHLAVISEKR